MNLKKVMTIADELRPNAISDEIKAGWLFAFDGDIAEMMKVDPQPNTWPEDTELLMPYPHDDIYQYYLMAMIDYANQEMTLYEIDYVMANAKLEDAKKHYARNNYTPSNKNWSVMI